MKLLSLKLENFRGFKNIKFDLSQNLHMIVGQNDIGKSTILEALDVFFNENKAITKISALDFCINSTNNEDKNISISCEFGLKENEKIIIDSSREISPKDEFLLNGNNNLEIKKWWNASLSTMKTNTSIICNIPESIDSNYLTMKNAELKKKINEIAPDSIANKSINSEMRMAIYEKLMSDSPINNYNIKEIDTKSLLEDKDFYPALEKNLPDYYLFKSDRKNTTDDDEVQNPLSLAVKNAIDNDLVKQKLSEIQSIIENELNQINIATIEKMGHFSSRLGDNLIPQINTSWEKAIKNDILDRNNIPINKKGSGIRRLLLLSYLMVQAEKNSYVRGKKDIIFAIEEPETSLHPNLQKKFIEELFKMANNADYSIGDEISSNINEIRKYKILITTHLPNYLSYATAEQVIYVSENDNGESIEIFGENEYKKIKDELGLLPNPYYGFVLFVEGENDLNFLKNLNKVVELKIIFDIEADDVDIIPLRGSNLLKSIEHDFYKELPVKQFHLYDSDVQEYVDKLNNDIIGKNDKWDGVVTVRKCMEYYIPKSLIEDWFGINLDNYVDQWTNDSFDLVHTISQIQSTKLNEFNNAPDKVKALKAVMNKTVAKTISKDNLLAHGVWDEIKGWFEKMKALKEKQEI